MPVNRFRYPAGDGVPRQSERTASENKERAYIAASRRSDRSLEARVQSAFAASQIHKDRTGKALKVTEEIVLKEEMYEEEDDLPARYQALMNNPLFAFSPRASAYAITQMGMRDVAAARFSNKDPSRLDEVNREFAQVFPGFGVPLPQTPLSEHGSVHTPTAAPGSHPPFSQTTPRQVTSSYSPATKAQQHGLHHSSPQNMALSSPFGSPAMSQIDSPVSTIPMMPTSALPSPATGPPMLARSMSMSQVEPRHMNLELRATDISPTAPLRHQTAGQRRSYDDAFASSQSPMMTPGFYSSGTGLLSPGMPPPAGHPASYNSHLQRRASAQFIPMSPVGTPPMHAAGFTTHLPANVRDLFQPQIIGRSGSLPGTQQKTFVTPLHRHSVPTTPGTPGASNVSHTTQTQFHLHGNLRQMQREKKEHKRRSTQEVRGAMKVEQTAEAKGKAVLRTGRRTSADDAGEHAMFKTETPATHVKQQVRKDASRADTVDFEYHHDEQQVLTPESTNSQDGPTTGSWIDNFQDANFDVNNFHQAFSTVDFNLDPFSMNFDENFDMNQFFTFPASQPENDTAQAVS
ncbi:hypothetical protein VPNG_02112 [Cytospora leucostoma]|uniref:Uncharacterized protein n=1 Tax=Cytospora leucostoma TaxID=1230097 RepID=A0A423XHF1_9PEZI|nr:hypothetical protein VPNG_02112 [Cytospora leucostoma]